MTEKTENISSVEKAVLMFDKGLYAFERTVSLICLIAMIVMVLYGIVMRFLLRLPNPYGEELSRYLMIYFVYLGVSINIRTHGHLAVEMIVDYLPESLQKICRILSDLITIIAFGVLTILAWNLIQNMLRIVQKSTQMRIPMWIVYISLLVGFGLSTIRAIIMFWNDYISKNKVLSKNENKNTTESEVTKA